MSFDFTDYIFSSCVNNNFLSFNCRIYETMFNGFLLVFTDIASDDSFVLSATLERPISFKSLELAYTRAKAFGFIEVKVCSVR